MKKYLILVCLYFSINANCQTICPVKIDSVFSECFNFLKKGSDLSYVTNEDSICFFYEKRQIALDFLENITGIFSPRILDNNNIVVIESDSILNKWIEWYHQNKYNLVWIDDRIRISNPDSKWFKCANYEDYYPNNIRFNCKRNEIPKSVPPQYIQDMIEKSHRHLNPIPAKIKKSN